MDCLRLCTYDFGVFSFSNEYEPGVPVFDVDLTRQPTSAGYYMRWYPAVSGGHDRGTSWGHVLSIIRTSSSLISPRLSTRDLVSLKRAGRHSICRMKPPQKLSKTKLCAAKLPDTQPGPLVCTTYVGEHPVTPMYHGRSKGAPDFLSHHKIIFKLVSWQHIFVKNRKREPPK